MLRIVTRRQTHEPIIAATRRTDVLDALQEVDFPVTEVVSTPGLLQALEKGASLVIVDLADLVTVGGVGVQAVAQALETLQNNGVPIVDGETFLLGRDQWLGQALLRQGERSGVRFMPPRVVLVTNYSGGVGKTTLSLALARRFRENSGLGAAAIEAGVGGSSFRAYLEDDGAMPSLYSVMTQGVEPGRWDGVSVYPLEEREARLIYGDERLEAVLREVISAHTLTVIDTVPNNVLWPHLLPLATDVLVVTTPREDAMLQAAAMLQTLKAQNGEHEMRVHVVANQVRSTAERLQTRGLAAAQIGYRERQARALDGRLADPLLEIIYPGWRA